MIAALLAAVLASVFDQHRQSSKTRDAIEALSTQVAGLAATSTAHSQQFADLKADHRMTQEQLGRINDSLGSVRERLARIEGHLRVQGPGPDENEATP